MVLFILATEEIKKTSSKGNKALFMLYIKYDIIKKTMETTNNPKNH